MRLTIHGPNLNDQSKGSFRVHAAGCADNGREVRRNGSSYPFTDDFASRTEVAALIYADQIAESADDAAAYVSDFHFAPCCAALR